MPRPTPTMAESSRGPRIRVTARKSVPIPRRAFADRTEAPAPPRVIIGVPIVRVYGMTWAEEQHLRAISSGLQGCQATIDYQNQVIAELVDLTHLITDASTEASDTARAAIRKASVAEMIVKVLVTLLAFMVLWICLERYWYGY